MTDLDTLKSLRERVLAASGPDRTLDMDIAVALGHPNLWSVEVTRSIDAALALVERMLPGWQITVTRDFKGTGDAYLNDLADAFYIVEEGRTTAPLAILAALLSALIAQAEASA